MLPGVEMESSFTTWDSYLHQLRSTYRRRCMHITEKWKNISTLQTSCTAFSDQHYQLYKDVLKHSSTKLETIPKEYFQNLPENFYLATSYKDDNMLCWHINCSNKGKINCSSSSGATIINSSRMRKYILITYSAF